MTIQWWPYARRRPVPRLSHSEKYLEIATIAVGHYEHRIRKDVDRQALIRDIAQAGTSAPNQGAAIDAMEILLEDAGPRFYWDGTEAAA